MAISAFEANYGLSHLRAWVILSVFLGVLATGSLLELRHDRSVSGDRRRATAGDIAMFEAVSDRVRGGESYYSAMAAELRGRHYPTASIFNWRTPLLYAAARVAPSGYFRVGLISLGAGLLMLTAVVLKNRAPAVLITALVAQSGAVVMLLVPAAPLLTENWTGVLIALSISAYKLRAWRTAACIGLLALFVRELAAPFVAVCAFLALRDRRRQEIGVWIAGAFAYGVFFAWHVHEVRLLQRPGDLSHLHSWLFGGGPAFLLETLRRNAWVLMCPPWTPAASAILAALTAAALWRGTGSHLRGTIFAYCAMFIVIGQPFNNYWGFVTAPTWGLAVGYGSEAVWQSFAVVRRSKQVDEIKLARY
jgi:hypothetical protein